MKWIWILTCVFLFDGTGFASEMLETDDIWVAVTKTEELSEKYGARKVVFVSDLDNTLLATKQELASEPWFNWQSKLLTEDSKSELRIACDFPDLLNFFHLSIILSQLTPVQGDEAKAIARLQSKNIATMILTARGINNASTTFRELDKLKIDLSVTSMKAGGYTKPYLPYDIKNVEASGITATDVERFKLAEARPVLYQRGVMFAEGQSKGVLLKSLIHRLRKDIKGIVFFDNDEKNTKGVFDAFKGSNTEVLSIRASHQDKSIKAFNESNKDSVTKEFLVFRKLVEKVYGYKRPCVLPIDKKMVD